MYMQNKEKTNNVIKKTQAKKISKMRLRRQKSMCEQNKKKHSEHRK